MAFWGTALWNPLHGPRPGVGLWQMCAAEDDCLFTAKAGVLELRKGLELGTEGGGIMLKLDLTQWCNVLIQSLIWSEIPLHMAI